MADTVKVPFVSKPLPKPAVFIGLGVTGLLIVNYYRKQNSAKAAGTPAPGTGLASGTGGGVLSGDTSSAYPWDGTYSNPSDPYSMDTTSGLTYGAEGYYGGYGVQGTQGTPSTIGQNGPPFSNNQQWSAYAIEQLGQLTQFDSGSVAEALGLYVNGRELTVNQEDIVYAAIGVAGPVPVRSASGYPPNLRLKPTGGKPPGGKTFAHNPVSGLHPVRVNATEIEVAWDKAEHATGYQVSVTDLTAHRAPHAVTTVRTSHTFTGLRPLHNHKITVLAKPAEKGAKAAEIHAQTIKSPVR